MLSMPETEWMIIKNEKQPYNIVFREYIKPMLLMVLFSSVAGSFLFHPGYRLSFGYLLASILTSLLISGGVMYLAAFFINEIVEKYEGIKNLHAAITLVAYSFTAFWLCYALAILLRLFPINILFYFCSFYSVYLFYTGSTIILSVPEKYKTRFTVVSVLLMLVLFILFAVILEIIFSGLLENEVTVSI